MAVAQLPRKVSSSYRPRHALATGKQVRHSFPVTVTRPDGTTFTVAPKFRKVARKRKVDKPKLVKVVSVSQQDTVAIELAERKARVLKQLGSIHAE